MKFSTNNVGEKSRVKNSDIKRTDWKGGRDFNDLKMKLKLRRNKANARERNRMHGLNKALDRLRNALPIKAVRSRIGMKHKLSKIETLKIARNYIRLLMNILKNDQQADATSFANSLAVGLSHATANVIISSISHGYCIAVYDFNNCHSSCVTNSGSWTYGQCTNQICECINLTRINKND